MTTGSLGATDAERRWYAARSRWWNSTGGGSGTKAVKGNNATTRGVGAVKAGDGGVKFRAEWAEVDEANWRWMKENGVDAATGQIVASGDAAGLTAVCSPEAAALRRGPGGSVAGLDDAGRVVRQAGQGWLGRNKWLVGFLVVVGYVLLSRALRDGET